MEKKAANRVSTILKHMDAPVAPVPASDAIYASLADRDCCIVAACRTPNGSFGGALASLSAPELGAQASTRVSTVHATPFM